MSAKSSKRIFKKEFAFNGEWIPSLDPMKIGENNFALLRNYRYIDGGIEPIEGYTEINTTALATQLKVRDAIQLRNSFTQKTFVLAEAWNTGLTSAKILVNKTAIPDQGDFEDETGIFSPASGAAKGRFNYFPKGIGYANESESCIYEGEEMRAAAVIRCEAVSNLTLTDPVDFSEELTNESQASGQTMAMNATDNDYVVFSTRPLQGIKVYIKTANTEAGVVTAKEWQGSWGALTVTDNTASGGITHAATGTITWTASGSAKPCYIEGYYLYAYHFTFTAAAGVPDIYMITVDAPFQAIVDVWDGVYRSCIGCQVTISSVDNDYTLEVNEESNIDYPIAARIGQLDTTDKIIVICEEQAAGINIRMIGGNKVNSTASVMTVKYWDGDQYTTVGTIYDGTIAQAGKTLSGSGVVSWDPIARTTEKPLTMMGVTGYAYELTVSVQLSGATADAILVDYITFIPSPRILRGHSFASRFQGRALFCADVQGKEENRVDYTLAHAPDVHNGDETSARGQGLYFGGQEKLTAGGSLYNRFGSQIYETWICTKDAESFLLNGTGPDDFKIYQISAHYGCPAPKTFSTAEIGYEIAKDALRNIAIWVSYRGLVIFDGAVVVPIAGMEIYFDPRLDTCINYDAVANAHGWFDPLLLEYNYCIPTGSSTTCDIWLAYDLKRKRHYQKYPDGGAKVPQASCLTRDIYGSVYPYVFTDDGIMLRDNYGTTWNGIPIIHKVKSADILPTGSIFDTSTIEEYKVLHQTPDFSQSADEIVVHITHYYNGRNIGEDLEDFSLAYSDLSDSYRLTTEAGEHIVTEDGDKILIDAYWYQRYAKHYRNAELKGLSHQFEFWRQSDSYSYRESFSKSLIGWGFKGIAEDYRDDRV